MDKTKCIIINMRKCISDSRSETQNYRIRNYSKIRWQAEQRGITFNLTKDEYHWILNHLCAYGGKGEPDGIKITLDRLNHEEGYSINNCCPACYRHNKLRGIHFTYTEFMDAVSRYPGLRECANRSND